MHRRVAGNEVLRRPACAANNNTKGRKGDASTANWASKPCIQARINSSAGVGPGRLDEDVEFKKRSCFQPDISDSRPSCVEWWSGEREQKHRGLARCSSKEDS